MNPSSVTDRSLLFRVFFFGVFLFLIYQLIRVLSPFFTAIAGAGTLCLIFYPLHVRLTRKLQNRPSLAAGLSTALLLLIVVLPVVLFAWILIREAAAVYPTARAWAQNLKNLSDPAWSAALPRPVHLLWLKANQVFSVYAIDVQDILLNNLDQLGGTLSTFGTKILKNLAVFVFDMFVLVFSLFFFFRDGHAFVRWGIDHVPMETGHKDMILERLDRTLSAVVRGVFVTAAVQGLLAGIGFLLAGVRFPVLLGFTTAFLAPIPFVGAAAVWLPLGLYTLSMVSLGKGLFLLLWGFFVVSLVDNFLRPFLIGEKANLPVLLLFFGILGGIQVYGFMGILIGPLMIAAVISFTKIYREQMQLSAAEKKVPPAPPNVP